MDIASLLHNNRVVKHARYGKLYWFLLYVQDEHLETIFNKKKIRPENLAFLPVCPM